MWQRWSLIRQFKLNLLRLLRLPNTAEHIARGLALGVFVGLTPTFGIQMAIALALAIVLRENKIAAMAGVWVTNPLTAPLIYALEYEIGRMLLGIERPRMIGEFSYEVLRRLGWEVIYPLLLGSLVLGVLCAALTYALSLRIIPLVRQMRIPRWPRRVRRRRESSGGRQ